MTTHKPLFGDLRAMMNAPYSRQIWEQLCDWAHQWEPHEYKTTTLPYLEGHLHIWDDALRFMPRRWLEAFIDNKPVQGAELVRTLDLAGWTFSGMSSGRNLASFPQTLFAQPQLRHLTRLVLSDNIFTQESFEALTSCPHLTNLAALDLRETRQNQTLSVHDQTNLLMEASWLASLHELDLSRSEFDFSAIFARLHFAHLHTLKLNHATTLEALAQLITYNPQAPLKHLEITHTEDLVSRTSYNASGLTVPLLQRLDVFDTLSHLDLSHTIMYATEAAQLAERSFTPTLHTLDLWSCQLYGLALRAMLEKWPHHSSLRCLNLGKNKLDADSIAALIEHPLYPQLEQLHLFDCQLEDDALNLIIDSERSTQIAHINIAKNHASDTLIQSLRTQPHLSERFRL